MNRIDVYKNTKEFLKGKWANIFVINLIFGVIRYAVQRVFTQSLPVGELFSMIESNPDFVSTPEFLEMMQNSSKVSPLFTYVLSPILGIFTIALAYEIVRAIRNDESPKLEQILRVIKDKFIALLVLSYLFFFINLLVLEVLNTYPYLSVLSIVVVPMITIMLSFSSYTIVDGGINGAIDAIKDSVRLTKGYKMDLFLIKLNYIMKIIMSSFPLIIGLTMFLSGTSELLLIVGIVLTVAALLFIIGVAIYYTPFMLVSNAMAYTMIVEEDVEEDIVSTIEKMVQETEFKED